MSNGNGQAPTTDVQSMHGGELAAVSKLLQEKAPEAVEAIAPHEDQTRPPKDEQRQAEAIEDESRGAAQEGAEQQTAAEIEAAAAEKAANAEKPAAEEYTDEERTANADQAAPLTVGDIAKKLGVDPRRLYEDLRIPLREGRGAITLSELKQGYQDNAILEDGRDKVAAERMALQADTSNAMNELHTASHLLAITVGPEKCGALLDQAQRLNAAHVAQGREIMLERFPEWSDPPTYDRARDDMTTHLAPFNFTRADLENIRDPRHVLYIQANMKRDAQVAAAQAKIEKQAPPPRQRAPSNRTPAKPKGTRTAERLTRQAQKTGTREDQLSAISAVLGRHAKD